MKKLLLSLTCLLLTMGMLAAEATINIGINPTNKTTSSNETYTTTEATFVVDGVTFAMNNWNAKTGQIRGNKTGNSLSQNFYLKNTSALPGVLKSITIKGVTLTTASSYCQTGDSEITTLPTSGNTPTQSADPVQVTWSSLDGEYFYLTVRCTGTQTMTGIEITYETDGQNPADPEKADPGISFSAATAEATMGEEFTAPTLTNTNNVTVTYSSTNESVATVNATSGAVTLVAAGTTDITATFAGNDDYKAATASYTLTVHAAHVTPPASVDNALVAGKSVFYESFNDNNKTGGNDGTWSGIGGGTTTLAYDNEGWDASNSAAASACGRFGAGSNQGSATTPALALNADNTYILTFKAGAWLSDSENTTINLSIAAGTGTITPTSVELAKGAWTTYTAYITGANAQTKVKFEAAQASKNRFFLDEVRVSEAGYSVTIGETGYATLYYGEKNLEVPAGVEAWTYVANTAGALTAKKSYHSADVKVIPAGEAVLLYTTNPATYVFNVKATAGDPEAENHLMGTDAEQVVTAEAGKTNYFLAKGSKGVGFYQVDATGTHTNGAHKAYLSISTPATGAPAMVALPGAEDVDGIVVISIDNVDADNNMYDIMGRPVNADYKGLVIKNGKKFINK